MTLYALGLSTDTLSGAHQAFIGVFMSAFLPLFASWENEVQIDVNDVAMVINVANDVRNRIQIEDQPSNKCMVFVDLDQELEEIVLLNDDYDAFMVLFHSHLPALSNEAHESDLLHYLAARLCQDQWKVVVSDLLVA